MHTQNCTNIQRTGKRRKQFDRRERETCVVVYYGRFACAAFDFQLNRCYSCFLSIALCIYEKPWFDCAHGHRRLCKCTCIVLYSFVWFCAAWLLRLFYFVVLFLLCCVVLRCFVLFYIYIYTSVFFLLNFIGCRGRCCYIAFSNFGQLLCKYT